jgi:hypothetical protein
MLYLNSHIATSVLYVFQHICTAWHIWTVSVLTNHLHAYSHLPPIPLLRQAELCEKKGGAHFEQ